MLRWKSVKFVRLLRILHRDLGFLLVGISLVYGISGLYLNHLGETDPAFTTEKGVIKLTPQLTEQELLAAWSEHKSVAVKKILTVDGNLRLMLDGGMATYNSSTGEVDYERHKQRFMVYWVNRLHYNKVANWNIVADIFAGSLIFLAISGLFLVKGKKGIAGRGKWFLIAGLLIPVLFIVFTIVFAK